MKKILELLRLDGRAAIITGGAGHIGLAIAETLAELGADVVIVDVDAESCRKRASEIATHGGKGAMGLPFDLASEGAAERIVDATMTRFGRIDIVVNNAAYTGASGLAGYAVPFEEQTLEAWEAALKVNLSAPFALVHAARAPLAASGNGSVINVGSIYGVVGPNMGLYEGTKMGNPAAYGASKGGLVQLTRYLATVMAPAVRVNAVSPGGIERGQPDAFQERYRKLTPLARMGTEEDLKGAVAYLASDASKYVTGQNLVVDGGWTAW